MTRVLGDSWVENLGTNPGGRKGGFFKKPDLLKKLMNLKR